MSDKKIKFIPDKHIYLSDTNEDLISVSKFTERFKEKVNWDEIAKRSAAKLTKAGKPTTKEDVMATWAKKREIGTLLHEIKELESLSTLTDKFYGTHCDIQGCLYEEGGLKCSLPINNLNNNTVYPELMIYDLDYMICGQSDKVIVVDNKIHIWDYKTDKEISFSAFSNKWVKPRKLLPPISHLDDCNGNLYSLKMSLYMYMLWRANKGRLKTGDIIIEHVHLKRDPEDGMPILKDGIPIILKTENIKLPYRKKEIIDMLKTLK